MHATYNGGDKTSHTVQTYIEVATLAEATEIAELWVEQNGGSATVHRRRGVAPWVQIERVATFGTRS